VIRRGYRSPGERPLFFRRVDYNLLIERDDCQNVFTIYTCLSNPDDVILRFQFQSVRFRRLKQVYTLKMYITLRVSKSYSTNIQLFLQLLRFISHGTMISIKPLFFSTCRRTYLTFKIFISQNRTNHVRDRRFE